MSVVRLQSRLPQIIAQLPGATKEGMMEVAEQIAERASEQAPRGATGELARSYEAGELEHGVGVFALWRYHFAEFGTDRQAAQPHLMPAVESERETIAKRLSEYLRDL